MENLHCLDVNAEEAIFSAIDKRRLLLLEHRYGVITRHGLLVTAYQGRNPTVGGFTFLNS